MALKDLFKLKKNKAEIDEDKNADALEKNLGEAVSEEVTKQTEEYAAEKPKPLKERLVKTKKGFFTKLKEVFTGKPIDDEMYEELEDLLIQSDLGFDMTLRVIEELEERVKKAKVKDSEEVYEILKQILREKISSENSALDIVDGKLNIILVVGVNGVGKTTSIGKIASKLKQKNKKVKIAAADTFRAAAIEQLEQWGKRTGVEAIKQ